jgi:hypothetical protein
MSIFRCLKNTYENSIFCKYLETYSIFGHILSDPSSSPVALQCCFYNIKLKVTKKRGLPWYNIYTEFRET